MRIAVIPIERIAHSATTEDGCHMVLTVANSAAERMSLGMPCDQLPELIDRCVRALSDSERVWRSGCDQRSRIEVTWWNLHRDDRSAGLALSLTFGSGGQLSFVLTPHMAAALCDSLAAHLDVVPPSDRGFGS